MKEQERAAEAAAPQTYELGEQIPGVLSVAIPVAVRRALDRMCTPLDESRLSGATAQEDARCMRIIREYIESGAAPVPAEAPALADVRRAALEEAARICDQQASEPECPERAEYCAAAIRALAIKEAAPAEVPNRDRSE